MSFAWDFALSTIEGVFSKAAGIPFAWSESLRRFPVMPLGVLSLADSRSVGRDGYRYTFRDSNVSLELYGYRELTITVQIRARLAKAAPSSRVLAEKARLALANPMYRDELRSAGLVFVETHPLLNLDFSRNVKKELRSSFDVVFRLLVQEKQQAEHIGFFDSVALIEHVQ